MNRFFIYYAIIIGIAGSIALSLMGRPLLMIGWWTGMAVALVNFSSLLSNIQRTKTEAIQNPKSTTASLRKGFFIRYLVLALVFFLILQLGRQQLGSTLVGFLTFYVVAFLDYLFRIRKQNANKSGN